MSTVMKRIPLILIFLILLAPPAFAEDSAFDLGKYKGKAVYLDFWASWCVPCKKSFGWMNEMQSKYGAQGLQIVAVNLDEDPTAADKFLKKHPVNFEIVYDPEGKLAEEYSLVGMPTAVLFDSEGKQVGRHVGFRADKQAEYEASLQKLLPAEALQQ